MKRILSVFLSICLMASLAAPVMAAPIKTSGAASTLKLESVTGTAQLKNASGKDVKVSKGTRLYNGYKLATEKASYAYVNLDDAKAIKLDASSSAEVFQSGKKLELKVNSGQMFFNVTEPLKSDESLTIRTSTMVTGVRGTSGWISVIDRFTTQISLLEGTLTITSTDPLTGVQRTITIVGGQTATIVYHGKDKNFESEIIIEDKTIRDLINDGTISDEHIIITDTGLTVETLQEKNVPGFVAVEVKKDKELQQKIEENSPLSVPAIIGDAEQRLENEKAAAEAADKTIQEEFDKLAADDVDPLFEAETPVSGGGSSGGGGGANSGDNTGEDATTYTLSVTEQIQNLDGSYTDITREPDRNVAANVPYQLDAPDGYMIEEIVGDSITISYSNDRTSADITIIRDTEILVTYVPLDEFDVGVTTYLLTVIERFYDPSDQTYSEPMINDPLPIQADQRHQILRDGYAIESITGIETYELSEDGTTAHIIVTADLTITVTYTPLDTSDSEYTFPLENPTTSELNGVITEITTLFMTSDIALELGLTEDQIINEYAYLFPTVTLNISGAISLDGDIDAVSFPANYVVNLSGTSSLARGITLDTAEGTQLNVTDGTFTNNGTISGQGTMTVANGATMNNSGTVSIESTNSMHVFGTLNNANQILVGSSDHDGKLVIEETGVLENNQQITVTSGSTLAVLGGTLTNEADLTNEGTITVENGTNSAGSISNNAAFTVAKTGTLTLNSTTTGSIAALDNQAEGTLTVYGTLTSASDTLLSNGGGLTVYPGATLTLGGTLNNISLGLVTVDGSMTTRSGSALMNEGTIEGTGVLTLGGTSSNQGTITNTGTINVEASMTNAGDLTNTETGKLNVTGTITVVRAIDTNGTMMVSGTVTMSNAGTLISVGGGKLTVTGGTLSNTYEGSDSGPLVTASPANEDAQGNPNSIDIQVINSSTITHSSATCFVIAGANSSLTVNNSSVSATSGDGISSIDEATVSVENRATVTGKTGIAAENSTLTVSDSEVSGTDGNGIEGSQSDISVTNGGLVEGFTLSGQNPEDIFSFRGWGMRVSSCMVTVDGGTVQGPDGGIYFDENGEMLPASGNAGINVISGTVQSTIVKTFEDAIAAGQKYQNEPITRADIPQAYGIEYRWSPANTSMQFSITIGDKVYNVKSPALLYPYYAEYDETGAPAGAIVGYEYNSCNAGLSANYVAEFYAERSITPTEAYTGGTATVFGNGALIIAEEPN